MWRVNSLAYLCIAKLKGLKSAVMKLLYTTYEHNKGSLMFLHL